MVTALKDEQILSLENKLNTLIVRVSDLERRLSALERTSAPSKPVTKTPQTPPTNVEHNYLRRAITSAKHDYERKYK